MTKDLIWIKFYLDDFTGGTEDMTIAELGAYFKLLLRQYRDGRLPVEKHRLMWICRVSDLGEWESVWGVIGEKFEVEYVDGKSYLFNSRAREERESAMELYRSRRKSAKNASSRRWKISDTGSDTGCATECGTECVPGSGSASGSTSTSTSTSDSASDSTSDSASDSVNLVWSFYQSAGHERAKLDVKRRKLIRKALKDYSVKELCRSIHGCHMNPFNVGQNESGTVYLGLEHCLGSSERIERHWQFADLTEPGRLRGRHEITNDNAVESYIRGLEGGDGDANA